MNQVATAPSTPSAPSIDGAAWRALILNTLAFTVCFAVWMMNGVLMTYLVDNGVHDWDPASLGWLIGVPVLTGSVMRLPIGMLTDKFGGKWVFGLLLLGSAIPTYLVGSCDTFGQFFLASLGFGMTGTGFAVGIAFTSVWFPPQRQGLALGIFGAGNAGAAVTSLFAPSILRWLTGAGEHLDAWRTLPKIYAGVLVVMGVLFLLFTKNRLAPGAAQKTLAQQLKPLANLRVWRFGLYYFYVFGGFVALAQWLIPYYVNAYAMSVVTAGILASIFSLPSGLVRAFGGWLSDLFGARTIMYWVFGVSLLCFIFLLFPQMDIHAPGSGVMARSAGKVLEVGDGRIVVLSKLGNREVYPYQAEEGELASATERRSGVLILPRSMSWQEPAVSVGEVVQKRQLLARGVTHIFFQANVWIFTGLVFVAFGLWTLHPDSLDDDPKLHRAGAFVTTDLTWRATPELTVTGNLAWNDSELTNYANTPAAFQAKPGGGPLDLTFVPLGSPLALAPHWQGGMRILERLEQARFDPVAARPSLGASDALVIAWRTLSS